MYICMYKAVVLPFHLKEMKAENQTCFLYLQQHLLYSGACGWWGRKDGGAAWLRLWNCVIAELQANTDTGFLGRCAVPEMPWAQKILPWHLLQPLLGWWRWWVKGEKLSECWWWRLKEVSPRNTPISHYEISNNWMDGLADVEGDGSPLVCQHCQPGTGLNAGHAGICSAFCTTSLKNKIKTNCWPQKGKTVKLCFPSAVGCLGFVLWQGWACVR